MSAVRQFLTSAGTLIASGLIGLTVAYQLGVPGLEVAASGPLGVPVLMISAVVFVIAAAIGGAIVHWINESAGYFIGYGAAVLVFVFGFSLPLEAEREARLEASERRAAAIERVDLGDNRARLKWIADVEAAGAHGSGEPPMLKVENRGSELLITNITDRDIACVDIARVQRDAAAPGGLARCPLDAGGACRSIRAGNPALFEPSRSGEPCTSGSLEFRVGSYTDPEPSWWSTTAFRDFEQRTEVLARDQARSSGLLGEVGWSLRFGTSEIEESARELEALLGEPARGERWRAEIAGFAAMKRGDHPLVVSRREALQNDIDAARAMLARIAEIRSLGENHERGVVPAMLRIDDEGLRVNVHNIGGQAYSVHVMRTGTEIFQGEPTEYRCPMAARGNDFDTSKTALIAPGESRYFGVPFDRSCPNLEATGFVFAVFDGDTLVFANESQLVRLETDARLQLGIRTGELERDLALTTPQTGP